MSKNKKKSWMSFRELNKYFNNPDLKIQHHYMISAERFIKDLDSIINLSKDKLDLYGKFDEFSILIDPVPAKKGKRPNFMNFMQKSEKLRLHPILNKIFRYKSHQLEEVKFNSWTFTDFDENEEFQVGKLYKIKPLSVTYNSTQQDFKYNKQIISQFCIEEASGNIKKLSIIDSVKKGKIKREKYIDDQKINRQHYNNEIRSHRLNRGLMKTFLFNQINKYYKPEYNQISRRCTNKTDSRFVIAQPIITKGFTELISEF